MEIDQRETLTGRVIGQSDGSADQVMVLPATSVEPETLQLQVEEPDGGPQEARIRTREARQARPRSCGQ